MSCFVTSDLTVCAIVQGMQRFGFIDDPERIEGGTEEQIKEATETIEDMADALRCVNERMVCKRYGEEYRGSDAVDLGQSREFTDAEIFTSCRCWLYQVDNGEHMSLDEITIKAGVQMLAETIVSRGLEAGTWKTDYLLGQNVYYTRDEYGDWADVYNLAEWDLAA